MITPILHFPAPPLPAPLRLLKAPSNLALNTSRDGASTTSLGNLFLCLTTLIFRAITPCSITTCPCKKSLSSFLVGLLQVLEGCYKVSPEPSLLQAEQPQLSHPVFTGEVLQPSDHLRGPPLDSLQQLHVLLMLGAPELNAVVQLGSHESGVEGQNHLPRPAGHTSFDAAQDTVGFLGCKRQLPAHGELLINQHPRVLLLRAALSPFSIQPVFVLGIALTHVQDLALGLVELHEVCTGPPLKPVKVSLDSIPSLQCVDHTTQLGVVGKLAEVAINPTVHVTDKDVKQRRSQHRLLRNATRHRFPLGHQAVDHNSSSATIQPIPYSPSGPSIKSMSPNLETRMSCRTVSNPLHKSSHWKQISLPLETLNSLLCEQPDKKPGKGPLVGQQEVSWDKRSKLRNASPGSLSMCSFGSLRLGQSQHKNVLRDDTEAAIQNKLPPIICLAAPFASSHSMKNAKQLPAPLLKVTSLINNSHLPQLTGWCVDLNSHQEACKNLPPYACYENQGKFIPMYTLPQIICLGKKGINFNRKDNNLSLLQTFGTSFDMKNITGNNSMGDTISANHRNSPTPPTPVHPNTVSQPG
ncbi:hypothetical protein QYF61_002067 [Mycteria americana]|uniref:Uncharacterized protein n=1 Tax=Mycteria americana TaxID=33587 RepID=A0AAN7SF60_MYCAM|nr:hypothetical protein QYF61_002067 [Mycteria americana]